MKTRLLQIYDFLTPADRLLIGFLLFISFLGAAGVRSLQDKGTSVVVFVENQEEYRYSLNQEGEYTIHSPYGSLQLTIQNGKAWVSHSTCPAKICIRMGAISRSGQTIVCVPNRVVIQVYSPKAEGWIDTVTQ